MSEVLLMGREVCEVEGCVRAESIGAMSSYASDLPISYRIKPMSCD